MRVWQRLRPRRIEDPDFGTLTYIAIPRYPQRSYWEAEWVFPPSGTSVSIALGGDETGPSAAVREWHLALPGRFERIRDLARPVVAEVLDAWLDSERPDDVLDAVTLTGFGVEDPGVRPVRWDVSFETRGDRWLSITIPFTDEAAGDPVIDT